MDDGLSEKREYGFRAEDVLFCANDRQYYFKRKCGDYVGTHEKDIARRLMRIGYPSTRDVKNGEVLSPLEEKLTDIIEEQRVDYALPLAGFRIGVFEQGNERILVTKELEAIEPVEGDWDVVRGFLEGLFTPPDNSFDQIGYVYAWLSRAMAGLLYREPNKGQALIVAGDPDCGKTLFSKLLRVMFGGRVGKPYAFLTGETRFNNELFSCSLQVIDDEADKTNIVARRHLVSGMKKFIAADGSRGEAKGGITFELQPHWRIVQLSNFEEDNLRVLPPLDDDVIDKLILLRGYKVDSFPMPTSTSAEQQMFFDQMVSELPAFMHFLIHEYEIPEKLRRDRFGVMSALNMDIVRRMDTITPWYELMLTIENEVLKGDSFWVGSATDLYHYIRHRDSSLSAREKERYTPKTIGKHLTKINTKYPSRCWQEKPSRALRLWVFVSSRVEDPAEEQEAIASKILQIGG